MVLILGSVSLASAEPWRFAVIGDTRGDGDAINTAVLSQLVKQLVLDKPDVVLAPGDLVEGRESNMTNRLREWRRVMAPLYSAGITVLPIRGNHEAEASGSTFRAAFPDLPQNGPAGEEGLTYSFNHKNALFVGLDQYVRSHRINQPWLNSVLAANRQGHIFVFSHESAFAAQHQQTMRVHASDRDAFWNSLGAAGARMYICGHDHLYARAAICDGRGRPVEQVIVGSGGAPFHEFSRYKDKRVQAQFFDNTRFGYLLVTVDGEKVAAEWKAQSWRRGGAVFAAADRFVYETTSLMARSVATQPAPVAVRVQRQGSADKPGSGDRVQAVR